jgi:hypothetical protein
MDLDLFKLWQICLEFDSLRSEAQAQLAEDLREYWTREYH